MIYSSSHKTGTFYFRVLLSWRFSNIQTPELVIFDKLQLHKTRGCHVNPTLLEENERTITFPVWHIKNIRIMPINILVMLWFLFNLALLLSSFNNEVAALVIFRSLVTLYVVNINTTVGTTIIPIELIMQEYHLM